MPIKPLPLPSGGAWKSKPPYPLNLIQIHRISIPSPPPQCPPLCMPRRVISLLGRRLAGLVLVQSKLMTWTPESNDSVKCEGLSDALLNVCKESSGFSRSPQATLRRALQTGSAFSVLEEIGAREAYQSPECTEIIPLSSLILVFPWETESALISHQKFVFPQPNPYYLFPSSCLHPTFPTHPPAKVLPLPLLARASTAKHSIPICQHPPPLSLPELEDDASGHENNDDGDGNCDIKLGVHT